MASTPTLVPSLANLSKHTIFIPPVTSTKPEADWELLDAPEDDVPLKTSRMVVRDKDVIVAHGKEVRIANTGGDGWEVHDGQLGWYKTLRSPHLDFAIQSLLLSTTGRLLAVIGKNQVVVVVLPKGGVTARSFGDLHCKSFPVDPFLFSPTSSSIITKALWHPWGEASNSLWILTSDGRLREYDVSRPEDPAQEFTFLPAAPSHSSFSAVDPLSRYCTSFAFGPRALDFGPTIVHVLCANGDLYYMGPVLPLRATVPLSWVQSVKVLADQLGGLKSGWVDSLVRQVDEQHRRQDEDDTGPSSSGLASTDLGGSILGKVETDEEFVRLHPPHLTPSGGPAPGVHRAMMRQGPVVLDPAPQESGAAAEDEDKALDLVLLQGDDGEVVYGMAWNGGRVDLGMMVDPPMPRWSSTRDTVQEDPTLAIIDSVLLPLSASDTDAVDQNAPAFVVDPLSRDLVYVQHSYGLDAISVKPWLAALSRDEDELPSSDAVRLFDSAASDVKPMIGTVVFCNIALGYGIATLASTHQLGTVELDFRIGDADLAHDGPSVKEEQRVAKEPGSLLSANTLSIDDLLIGIRAKAVDPRTAARAISTAPINSVSGQTLRQIAEVISKLQSWTQQIRAASQALENHLDLCAKEFQRQIRVMKQCQGGHERIRDNTNQVRAAKLLERQGDMAGRLDKVLAKLGGQYRPDVGEVERKWFEEVERLRRAVGSEGGDEGLAGRADALRIQLESLRPELDRQAAKEDSGLGSRDTAVTGAQDKSTRTPDSPSWTASSSRRIKPLEYALSQGSDEIKRLMRKMESLSVKMDVALETKQEEED